MWANDRNRQLIYGPMREEERVKSKMMYGAIRGEVAVKWYIYIYTRACKTGSNRKLGNIYIKGLHYLHSPPNITVMCDEIIDDYVGRLRHWLYTRSTGFASKICLFSV
jgi:hypothetical protein